MSSSLALRVVKVARAPSLFTKSCYPLFRPTSPVVAPFVGRKRDFTAPSLLLHAGSSTGSPWAGGHRNFSTKSSKTQSLPSSDEDEDNHIEFISGNNIIPIFSLFLTSFLLVLKSFECLHILVRFQ